MNKQLICDEFLIEYYKNNVLPLIIVDAKQRNKIENILGDILISKYDNEKKLEKIMDFYFKFHRISNFFSYFNVPQQKAEALLNVLKQLQQILFQIPRYRDHLLHQFRVYLLGCYILQENQDFFVEQLSMKFSKILAREINKEDKAHRELIKESLFYGLIKNHELYLDTWAIVGLCHDLGYSVEGFHRILKRLCEIYKSLVHEFEIEESVMLTPTTETSIQIQCFSDCIKFLFTNDVATILQNFIHFLEENRDHGIWCAFLLTPHDLAENIRNSVARLRERFESATLWDLVSDFYLSQKSFVALDIIPLICVEALIAISFHNKQFLFRLSPLAAILVISDTLQEWDRISFSSSKENFHRYLPIYLQFERENQIITFGADIYTGDNPPEDIYESISKDFDARKDEAIIKVEDIKSEFIENLKFDVNIISSFGKRLRISL
jgi:flagella basal body P-ring formation protein FlgA